MRFELRFGVPLTDLLTMVPLSRRLRKVLNDSLNLEGILCCIVFRDRQDRLYEGVYKRFNIHR